MPQKYTDQELDQLIDLAVDISLRREEEALLKESEDASTPVPPLSPELLQQLDEMIRRESAPLRFKKQRFQIARAAAVFLIAILTLTMSVDASRLRVLNTLMTIGNEFFNLNFQEGEESAAVSYGAEAPERLAREPEFIPEGYTRQETKWDDTVIYTHSDGRELLFSFHELTGTSAYYNNEGYIVEQDNIAGGSEAWLGYAQEKHLENYVVWRDFHYIYNIFGYEDIDTLIEMAESVK